MRKIISEYRKQFDKILTLEGICWWIIDYEAEPEYFYYNELMAETFSLDKTLQKHSVALTCPIAGDYNKNIELVGDSKEKAQLVFDEYTQLIKQILQEYNNQFPYYNKELDKTFYFSSRAKVLEKNEKNEISVLYGIIEDITLQEEQRKELEKLSQTDKLTGLYNRLKLDQALKIEVNRMKRQNTPLSVIIMDIDMFKEINDSFGHLVGDKVIEQVAALLKTNTRTIDVIGRWGGEEFLIICPNTKLDEAKELAEKLRRCIESFSFDTVKTETASFGVSEFKSDDNITSFVNRADKALYKAKDNGRNRVEVLG